MLFRSNDTAYEIADSDWSSDVCSSDLPNSTGHCLIVPKEHYQDFFDIDKEVLNHVLETAKVIANRLKERLNCDGITFAQNNGLGQDVKHYHLHLIPKYHNDEKLAIEEVYNKLK